MAKYQGRKTKQAHLMSRRATAVQRTVYVSLDSAQLPCTPSLEQLALLIFLW